MVSEKKFGAEYCLLLMIRKWKNVVNNNKVFDDVLTDLSNTFDCICHDLLDSKLHAYGPITSSFESDSRLPPGLKTKYKNWIFIQYMEENYL